MLFVFCVMQLGAGFSCTEVLKPCSPKTRFSAVDCAGPRALVFTPLNKCFDHLAIHKVHMAAFSFCHSLEFFSLSVLSLVLSLCCGDRVEVGKCISPLMALWQGNVQLGHLEVWGVGRAAAWAAVLRVCTSGLLSWEMVCLANTYHSGFFISRDREWHRKLHRGDRGVGRNPVCLSSSAVALLEQELKKAPLCLWTCVLMDTVHLLYSYLDIYIET